MKEKIIGIDLGTTNSCVAVVDDGEIIVLENDLGKRTTPSVVAFKNNEINVGEIAKRQLEINKDSIASIKRLMGTNEKIKINDKEYTPEIISSMIIGYIKEFAEKKIGSKIEKAVITVPAYFDNNQREATKKAGELAGLKVERIINEPTAAAMSYGYKSKNKEKCKILVYDLGGGTFDVSLLELDSGIYNVLATSGDNHLGGDDWDNKIVDWLIQQIKNKNNIDITKDKMAMSRLKEAAEKAKIELSQSNESQIILPFLAIDSNGPINFEICLSINEFDQMTKDLVLRTKKPIENVLEAAKISANEIDEVLLVGGSTRIKSVVNLVKDIFKKELNQTINPDEVVAQGAAVQGAILSKDVKGIVLLDVTPLSLGTSDYQDKFCPIIEKNTTIPVTKSQIFTTVENGQTEITFEIYQGENSKGSMNKLLGECTIEGLDPMPAGEAQVDFEFSLDVNGILKCTATDLKTKKSIQIEIKDTNKISN